MIKIEHNQILKRATKHIPLSATLIASILLALNPKEQVMAKEMDTSNVQSEIKHLHTTYHSLLAELDESTGNLQHVMEDQELINLQEELARLVAKSGREDLAQEIQQEKMLISELDELLQELAVSQDLIPEEVETEEIVKEEIEENIENKASIDSELTEDPEALIEEVEEELEVNEEDEEQLGEESQIDKNKVEENEELPEQEVPTLEESDDTERLVEEELVEVEDATDIIESVEEDEDEQKEPPRENSPNISATSLAKSKTSVSYTVRAGDTLNKIARAYNVSVHHLIDVNNISNKNLIRVGQVLMIDGKKTDTGKVEDLGNLGKPLSNQEFIEFLGGHAAIAAKENNLYASVMIAQAALESGFGTSGLSSAPNYNLYGMKGRYQGQSVLMRTREYSNSKGWHYVNAHFKKYPSYLESLLDHSAYIRRGPSWSPEFYSGVWRENTQSYRDATSWLQGRYATDPAYANKLNQIIERFNLTRFDTGIVEQPPVDDKLPEGDVKPSTGDKESDTNDITTYQVKRGDTLSHIARAHQMTVHGLKNLNNLTSDLILVNQVLKVKEKVAEIAPVPPVKPDVSIPNKPANKSYTIQRGDTLSHIARRYKITVRELKQINQLTSDLILVGQKLNIPGGSGAGTKPTAPPTPTRPSTPSTSRYTVQRGDTLTQIARRYKTTVSQLKSANKLLSDRIYVGQQLVVNSSSHATSQSYKIKAGDTLSAIARRFNTTVNKLKQNNNLTSDLIFVNQILKI